MTIVLTMPPVNPFSARHTASWSFVALAPRPVLDETVPDKLISVFRNFFQKQVHACVLRVEKNQINRTSNLSTLPSKIFGSVDFSGRYPCAADTITPVPPPTASKVSTLAFRFFMAAE